MLTLVSHNELANPTTTTSPKSNASPIAVQAGDKILVWQVAENGNATFTTAPSSTGTATVGTFTSASEASNATQPGNACRARLWQADVSVSGNMTLSLARTGTAGNWNGGIAVVRDENGLGTPVLAALLTNAAPSLAITTTQPNSAVFYFGGDWTATASARTYRAINGSIPSTIFSTFTDGGGSYGTFGGWYADAGAAGAKTAGLSAPTMRPAHIAVEVIASTSTDATVTAPADAATGAIPAPTVSADAAVTAPADAATGAIPAPAVSGSNDATVTAPAADAIGDVTAPAVSADATVAAPAADAAGDLPSASMSLDSEVQTGPASGVGDMPAPTVTTTGDGTVTAPAADAAADVPAPAVSADGTVTAPAADAIGDMPAPAVSADATVAAPAADAAGDLPSPTVTGDAAPPADVIWRHINDPDLNEVAVNANTRSVLVSAVSGDVVVTAPPARSVTVTAKDARTVMVAVKEARGVTVAAKDERLVVVAPDEHSVAG